MDADGVPFGPFTLLDRLAAGGMGEVWLAQAVGVPGAMGALCVVKRVKSTLQQDDDVLLRFLDESRLALLLSHPRVCRTIDAGRAEGCDYLAVDLVEGLDLRQLLARAPVDAEVALVAIADALDGLAYAHGARHPIGGAPLGIVHRDVSPHNLMADTSGHVNVIDFGLALSSVRAASTEQGVVLGKLAYMSPEQARGDAVDGRCDVWAAGVLLYEMLARERFYEGLSNEQIWRTVGGGFRPAHLDRVDPGVRLVLEEMLVVDPLRRLPAASARDGLRGVIARLDLAAARARLSALVESVAGAELARVRTARERAFEGALTINDGVPPTISIAITEERALTALYLGSSTEALSPGPDAADPTTLTASGAAVTAPANPRASLSPAVRPSSSASTPSPPLVRPSASPPSMATSSPSSSPSPGPSPGPPPGPPPGPIVLALSASSSASPTAEDAAHVLSLAAARRESHGETERVTPRAAPPAARWGTSAPSRSGARIAAGAVVFVLIAAIGVSWAANDPAPSSTSGPVAVEHVLAESPAPLPASTSSPAPSSPAPSFALAARIDELLEDCRHACTGGLRAAQPIIASLSPQRLASLSQLVDNCQKQCPSRARSR